MMKAMETRQPIATELTKLFGSASATPESGFLVFLPVFAQAAQPTTPGERQEQLRGYVVVACSLKELVSVVFEQPVLQRKLVLRIWDEADTTPGRLIFPEDATPNSDAPVHHGASGSHLSSERQIKFAGRTCSPKQLMMAATMSLSHRHC